MALSRMGAKDRRLVQLEVSLRHSQSSAAALMESELRYRRLFEAAMDGILILDAATGRVIDANPCLQELLGCTLNEMRGEFFWDLGALRIIAPSREAFRTLQENEYLRYEFLPLETGDGRSISVEFVSIVHLVGRSRVIQCNFRDITARQLKGGRPADRTCGEISDAVSDGSSRDGRLISRRLDGTLCTADARITPVRDAAGLIVNYVSVGSDPTEHRLLTAQYQEAQKLEAVGLLAGGVAHDYNNMLTVILGNAELALQEAADDSPLRRHLEDIHQAARRSAAITRQLLTFARRQTIAPVALDLNRSIEAVIPPLRTLVGECIELAWKPGADLWPVRMDPVQVSRVLAHLCLNARNAIADTGHIAIETCNAVFTETRRESNQEFPAGEYVMLAVKDDGNGISHADLERIYEPLVTPRAQRQSPGLALSSVYELVRRTGGFINVHGAPGSGTTVRVYLRRHVDDLVAGEADPADDAPRGHGETVLVVEDEPALLHVVGVMLTRLGYDVLAAASPSEALALAAKHRGGIRILLTDVVMPQMNGRSLAIRLQADCPGMRHLFMSGYAGGSVLADDGPQVVGNLIQKPFSTMELAVGIRAAIDRSTAPGSEGKPS